MKKSSLASIVAEEEELLSKTLTSNLLIRTREVSVHSKYLITFNDPIMVFPVAAVALYKGLALQ